VKSWPTRWRCRGNCRQSPTIHPDERPSGMATAGVLASSAKAGDSLASFEPSRLRQRWSTLGKTSDQMVMASRPLSAAAGRTLA